MAKNIPVQTANFFTSIAKALVTCILFVVFIIGNSYGEGTRELWPSNESPNESGCLYLTTNSDYLVSWGKHSNTDDNLRIKFTISSNWANEVVFIGLSTYSGSISNFYIRYPDGSYTAAQPYPAIGSPGRIQTYNQAVAGPNTINVGGYTPFVFTPTMPGDYSIDFEGSNATFDFFDLTVASTNTGPYVKIPGRLWAKVWQLSAMYYSNPPPNNNFNFFSGRFYIYSDDHIITKFESNGIQIGACDIYCNEWGTSTAGAWEQRRKSINGQANVVPQYKMFLNEPDPNLFEVGVLGTILGATQTGQSCDGSVVFTVVVDKPGKVTMTIDLLPVGVSPEDVTLTSDVIVGANNITWNGLNGLGMPVNSGASINMKIDYLNSLTNLPLFDVEGNTKGIKVDLVKPLPSPIPPGFTTKLNLYWDDTNLSGGLANLTGCLYPTSPTISGCHSWLFNSMSGLGDNHTVNTWWYFLSQNNVNINVNIIRTPGAAPTPAGPNPVCQGQTEVVYTVPVINSADSYVWTLPDGSSVTTATNQISLSFPTTTGGSLYVRGQNIDCGLGTISPPFAITVNPNPVPGIVGPAVACQGTNSTYTVTSGLTSYLWTVTGGTIVGLDNTSTVNINWTGSGSQTVNVTTTSVTCPNILTTKPVTINPQPATAFNYTNNCAAQSLQFNDLSTVTAGGTVTNWSWNFGDPGSGVNNTSSLQNPIHVYATGNTYTVGLTATSNLGCVKAFTQSIPVISPPTANAGAAANVCQNSTYTLNGIATNNSAVSWSHNGTGGLSSLTSATPTYTPGAGETGNVTFTLTAIGNTPCGNVTSTVVLTVNPPATAVAGTSATICEGSTFPLSGAVATNHASLLWTRSGTGSFDNPTSLNPIYTPSLADIAAGTVTLTLTATGLAACSNASGSLVLTISRQAVIEAGPPGVVCQTSSYTLSGATAQYYSTFTWTNDGLGSLSGADPLHPVYTPDPDETGPVTFTLTANPLSQCLSVTDSFVLTVNPRATASAGSNETICETGSFTLSEATATGFLSTVWTTSGDGTFTDDSQIITTYTPGTADIAAGFADLSLTANAYATCTDASDLLKLTINKQAIAIAGSDEVVCQDNSILLKYAAPENYSTLLWTHNGMGNLTGATNLVPVYIPDPAETGVVTLTLTAYGFTPCVDATDILLLTVNEAVTVSPGLPATICEGSTYTFAGSSASGHTGLLWTTAGDGGFDDASILNPTYTPGTADIANGFVQITIKGFGNPSCADQTAVVNLNITRQVTVDAGNNDIICQTETFSPNTAVSQFYDQLLWTHNGAGTLTAANTLIPVYTPGAGETGTITLTLVAEALAPCTDVSDQMQLTINEQAQAFAGPTATICEGSTIALTASTASGYDHLLWATSGSGTFSNNADLNPVYTPSNNDILAGSVTLTLTAFALVSCADVPSAMTLNITRQVTVDAGNNDIICQTETFSPNTAVSQFYDQLVWSHNGAGTLTAANTLTPVYTPGAGETGTITLTLVAEALAPCTDVSDQMQLTINEQAQAFAGPTATICEGSTIALTASTASGYDHLLWATSGDGTFSDNTDLNPVYTPSNNDISAGSVTLTLTAFALVSCADVPSAMTLNITRQVTVDAGNNDIICQTETFSPNTAVSQFYDQLVWSHNGAGTLTAANTLTPVYTPGAGETGTITLTLVAEALAPCTDVSDQMQLTINEQAQAFAGPSATICEGSTIALTASTASGYDHLLWSSSGSGTFTNDADLNPVYTPSNNDILAGSVTLTLTAFALVSCADVPSAMTLNITRQVTVDAGSNGQVCQNSTFTVNSAVTQFQSSVLWTHNGSGMLNNANTISPTYTPGAGESGTITLILNAYANAPCSDVSDQISLTISEAAGAYAGNDFTICEGETYALSEASASGYTSLAWTRTGSGNFSNSGILNPVYTPSAADIAAGNVILTVTSIATPPCLNSSSSMTLYITRQVTIDAGANGQVCQNAPYTVSGSDAQHFNTINWTHNGLGLLNNINTLTPTYIPASNESGTITLTLNGLANSPCADVNDVMQLTVHPLPVADAGPDEATCQGFNYSVAGASGVHYSTISWTENGTGSLINPTSISPTYIPGPGETGNVTLTMTMMGTNSCSAESSTDSRTISINPLPVVSAGSDATICAADVLTLNAVQQFCSSVLWTTSGDGSFTDATQTGTTYTAGPADIAAGSVIITITGNGAGSCSALNDVDQLTLTIDPMPAINAGPDESHCVQDPIQLTGTSASNYTSFIWNTSGDGLFDNPANLAPIYAPGNIDFNNGTVTLTLWAQGRLACATKTVTDTRIFNVAPYPVINAGTDDYICSDVTQFQLNGVGNNYNGANIQWTYTGGDGTFSNPNVMNPIYFAGPIDLSTPNRSVFFTLTLQGNGSCSGIFITDDIELKIDPTPISNAGPDDATCGQRPYQLAASGQFQSDMTWTTSGDGLFSNTNTFTPTYTPGPNDVGNTVVLTLELEGCKNQVGGDFMWLTVHPDPSVTISGSELICEGASTPITIDLTGTPPWSVTYTNGTGGPVTVNNISASPYIFNVSPPVTANWWIMSANDAYCNVPADSVFGLASISVNALPDPFWITGSNGGNYCEGDTGVLIGLNNSELGMSYELLQNGLATGLIKPGTGAAIVFGIFSTPGQYSIRGTNPLGNCIAMMNGAINVVMNPTPVTDFTTNVPCSTDTTYFTLTGNYLPRTSSWHWAFGDGTFATFNAPYSPYHLYPTYGTYTVILSVEDTNGCQYTVTHPVEVKPHPTAFFSIGTPNCLGNLTQFTDLSGNPAGEGYVQTWIWDFGDGSPKDTIDFPDSPNVMHQYATQGNYNVHLTILNSRGCSDEFQQVVSVTNRPVAGFNSWSSCEDKVATFTDISDENLGGQITTWNWNFGEPTSGTQNFSTLENPVHTYSTPGNFEVTLIITNLDGCSDTIQNTVNVKSKPLSNFFSSPGCVNSETQFLADSTLINTGATAIYQWNFGDGETSFSQYPSHSYVAPGTYYVTLTVTDTAGCVGDTILPVIVNPPPTAHFSANTDNCQGQSVAFANQSVSNSGFITTWEWNFGDGNTQTVTFPDPPNVNHTYAGTGTFDVTLTVTNNEGCSHFETRQVNSLGAPSADFMSSGQCAGTAVNFTDLTSVTGNQVLDNWSWNFGDPTSGVNNTSILKNPTHVFVSAGTYSVKLITFTGNNCSDTITKTVTVKPIPAVDFTTQSACAGNPALFAPAGVAVNTISGWYWTFGDGGSSNIQAPTHSYTSPGTFTVTLTITDTAGCSNTISKPLIIAPLPDANFSFSTPTCKDDAVSFTDFSSAVTGYVARWTWDFGDGNIQNILFPANPSVIHQYANAGTFNVVLTVKTNDSCTNQLTRIVTILPKPTAAFAYGAACQGNSVTFNDQSISNTTGSISGWNWNFGDPTSGTSNSSTLQHPTHIYSTAGTYTAQLIVSIPGGCSDTITHSITVSPPPSVDFTPLAGCNGDTTQFTATVNSATTQGYYWQFGDGGTSFIANPIHIYGTAGTFTVILTITDTAGCINAKVKPVTVIPGPVAAFSSSSPGCSGLPITFTDLSNANGGTITSWYWDFGDGTDTTFTSATSSFAHTFSQPGTFAVKLTVFSSAGCENLKQQMVTISPSPLAAFDYENTCQGQSTQFTDLTNLNGGSSLTQRVWNFGDPNSGILNTSTQTNPIHTYTLPGTYIVTLVTLNGGGCVDTIQQNVSITPKPGVDFYNDSLVCFGNTITLFTDTTVANIAALSYFEWDFGDGSPHAFTQNASHQYNVAGTFIVTLSVQDTAGCENFISRPITIHAKPNPQFTYLGICENAATQFTDQSLAPQGDTITNWLWEFMQGATTLGTDSVQNPNFTFNQPGTFSVKLTTFTEHGCNDTRILPVQIWNKPTAYFNYTASPCANGLVTFQDSSWSYQGLVNSWAWEFEPYQYGTGTHPSHQYYAVDSCYAVTLMIEDLRGCMDTVVQQICVPPALSVDFNTELTCFGSPVTFTPELVTPAAPADSLITFSWNFGDPTTGSNNVSTQKTPAHNYSSVGFYTVSFSTTDKFGCTAEKYKTVKVNALPVANFSYTTGQCDSTLIFSSTSIDTSSTINTFIWQYGDGGSDTLTTANTTHKYNAPGEYTATLTIINGNGCTATHSATVTRSACLVAATMSTQSLLCQNQTVSFADISTCDGIISKWDWNFGDGSPSESYTTFKAAVTHTFTNPGPYTISLKVSTMVGTSVITDSTSMDIVVKPTPVAGFAAEAVCLGVKTEFSDTTQTNGATMLYYRWEFGDEGVADTSNLKNPDYLYSVAGIYSPELIVQNDFGCADTVTSDLTVNGLPDAGYANSLACAGQKTYFFDASQPYVDSLTTWGWCVDDSLSTLGYMTGATPTFTFDSTGTYHVMLTVADINGCADTLIQNVTVNPAPVSAFSYTENVENIQGQVQFTNGTIGASEYYWDFGNGAISYEDSPLITYAEDGLFTVMLVSVSNEGCHDTTMITYEMMFKGLYVPNAIAPGGTIQATRIWKPVGVNLATYTAEIYNSHGMLLWKSTLLDENGAPAESWDGTFKDKPCQQDVYVWKITAIYRDGSIWYNTDVGEREGLSEPKWGTVTLIR